MKERTEQDSLGEVKVPESALYGAQTQRAVDNFGLHGRKMPPEFIRNLAKLKAAAAHANQQVDAISADIASAIEQAAKQIWTDDLFDHFPVSVFQTGSGTSTNMNMNEVLSRIASLACGTEINPNDHVNCSQSSNDVIPSCLQIAALGRLHNELLPALEELDRTLEQRAEELMLTCKTGRTHLMDAMPITFGQEIGAWKYQLGEARERLVEVLDRLQSLPVGGSAVGTGVNVPEGFPSLLVKRLSELIGHELSVCPNPYSRMAGQDVALECSAALRGLAVVLTKINSDIRWMSSGPLSGLAEITLKPLQPGSSIMPGKVNPVLPEAVLMVCAETGGNDAAVYAASASGNFQLNVMLPLIADKLDSMIGSLTWALEATRHTLADLTVNTETAAESLANNPILVTALNTRIGYKAAAAIAQQSYREKRPVIDVAAEKTDIPRQELEELLDPVLLTGAAAGNEGPD